MSVIVAASMIIILLVIMIGQLRKNRLLEGKNVTPDEALEAWHNKEFFIDVRTPEEYARGHVPGAALIPLQELTARMEEIPKDRKVLLICRSGHRSANATLTLIRHQYSNVYNVSGGMLQWKGPAEA